jgi:hypothetical protein
MNFDIDDLNKAIDDAPIAGYANVNYGKVSLSVQAVSWKDRQPIKRELTKKEPLKEGENVQLVFKVDIQEFNPVLDFTYERNVDVKKSSPRTKTNWTEIVEPSLIAVFGKDYLKALVKSPYVLVEDVADVNGRQTAKGKDLTTIKFLKAFKNKAECEADRNTRFAGRKNGSSGDELTMDNGIPASVIKQAQGLIASVGEDQAKVMLAGKPLGDYDPDELMEAALNTASE